MTKEWYDSYYGNKETEEFRKWWIKNYQRISSWDNNAKKYYDRRAYALLGWLAARDTNTRENEYRGG